MDKNCNISLNHIFADNLKNIEIIDQNSINALDKKRAFLQNADRLFLRDNHVTIDLDNIEAIPNGRFRCHYRGIDFEMKFNYKPGMPLIVVLNGAKTSNYPEFKRWSWYPFFQGSMLNIADPMYKYYDDLYIGWYYGDKNTDYRKIIVDIILKIAAFLKLPKNQIILYASSGGGAACPEIASLIGEGCTCIMINPQIYLDKYYYCPTFESITGIKLGEEDGTHRNDTEYWIRKNTGARYIFVENIAGRADREDIVKLSQQLGFAVKYGITKFNNVIVWAYDARTDLPHNAQEDFCTYFQISFLRNLFDNEYELKNYENLYLLFSEQWKNHWHWVNKCSNFDKSISEIKNADSVVWEIKGLKVFSNNSDFNAKVFTNKLLPNTTYVLELRGINIQGSTSDLFTFGIKDKIKNYLIFQKNFSAKEKVCRIAFLSHDNPDLLELKIYAGIAGKTKGISLTIESAILKKSE